ncbi:MAG: hypothetical protein LUC87_05125 [Clostridiales bacterium]|nr:hypothetical protein [Clostridiales bacterium]MCD8366837.1 hypothetical protein [Clostridiales bacterium]
MDKNTLNKVLTFVYMALLAIGVILFITSDFLDADNAHYGRLIGGIACGLLSSFVKTYIDMNQ